MTREEILNICRHAPQIGAVKPEEFSDFVVVLNQRKKVNDEWTNVESVYMAVDGKLAMANEDHRRQGKRMDFGSPQVLVDNEDQLTLLITINSELYGTRHGIATSRRNGGTPAEREFPWEVAETSAIGRALSAMGYGLFPGSGLASAEDMMRTGLVSRRAARESGNGNGGRAEYESAASGPAARPQIASVGRSRGLMSVNQKRKLLELYVELHGGSEADAARGLETVFVDTYHHGLNEATYDEASQQIGDMINASRAARAAATS